jgi:septal ring factor EnvC (AmiA/AmiB activator)
LFQTKPELLRKPYRVESGVSLDLVRVFVGAIGGAVVEVSDANVPDLSHLCDEFKFIELAKAVGDWQAEHSLIDAEIRRELDRVRAALEEQLESQDRTISMLEQALYRRWEDAISDAKKLAVMEAELSGLRSNLREVLGNLEGKHERLQATVTRQGDELAETCRRNEELCCRVQPL